MFSAFAITAKVCLILCCATYVFGRLINPVDARWVRGKPLLILCVYYAVGMLSHNVWVVYALMFVTLPVLAKGRSEAAALYVVAIGALPDLQSGMRLGGAAIMNLDKYSCIALGFTCVFLSNSRRGLRTGTRFDLPFLLLLALEYVQARGGNTSSITRSLMSTTLSIGLPLFLISRSITKIADLRRLMIALIYLGFVLAVVGIFESRSHLFVYQQLTNFLGVNGLSYRAFKLRAGMLRSITVFGDATAFSLFLSIILMATIACRESFRTTGKFLIALSIVGLGIFVTSSRNAWVSVIIALLAFDIYRRRFIALSGKMALIGMGFALLQLLAQFSTYFATMTGQSEDTASTSDYRNHLLTRGIEEFRKHPFFGVDSPTLMRDMHDLVQGEGIVDFVNGYLYFALTAGFGGLVALAMAFLLSCWAMLQSRRAMQAQGPFPYRTAAFVFAVSLSSFFTTAFTGFGGTGSSYFFLTLGIGTVIYSWRRLPATVLAESDVPGGVPGSLGRKEARSRAWMPAPSEDEAVAAPA